MNIWRRGLFYGILVLLRIAYFSDKNTERVSCIGEIIICVILCIDRNASIGAVSTYEERLVC
jgi:hypothetical protein